MISDASKLENISDNVTASGTSLDVTCRPRNIVAAFNKKYPMAGQMADQMRAARIASGSRLPVDWCFLPVHLYARIVNLKYPAVALQNNPKRIAMLRGEIPFVHYEGEGDIIPLAAANIWDKTRVAVRFDPTMYRELVRTPFGGDLPCDVLLHPRHWCQYFYTPQLRFRGVQVHGAFVFLYWDEYDQTTNWMFVLDLEGEKLFCGAVELGPWSLTEAIKRVYVQKNYLLNRKTAGKTCLEELQRVLEPLMSMYLYMCSKAPDIIGDGIENTGYPQPVKTKRGLRFFAPDNARTWEAGVRIGAAIRQAACQPRLRIIGGDTTGHASPRPHVRCAHWHLYWVGSLKSPDRKTDVRWIHPILVNVGDPTLLPMVIRPVKAANDD